MSKAFLQFIEDLKKYYGIPSCILDIGSRDCEQSVDFLEFFPDVEIHAFEPSSKNYKLCVENATGTSIKTWNCALSNTDGYLKFFYSPANIGASSLLSPNYIPWAADQTIITETVQSFKLDTWCADNNVKPDVLWVDVQGAEGYMFAGAEKTLKNVKVIYSEMGIIPYYKDHTLRDDIVKNLQLRGFEVVREEKDWANESNLTLVRRELLA